MLTANEIRRKFLEYFKDKGHTIVPSAPIVIKNDPTLLFTNAGMNQFKDNFLGNAVPLSTRIADTQKCLRVSGKHNDLEEVGVDTYHHTMFEMLGNWSFGDYFKQEAIEWSWDLLTNVYGMNKDRLYVTVFAGAEAEGLAFDEEAYNYWKQYVPEDRILRGNKKDNFWEMGDTGPCGPCSEIHVDCRTDAERALVDGKTLVNADHPQVIEIWNNVFMQFNRLKDGSLVSLPAKHVDTGMGLERLVRVLQGKQSNYDTDLFTTTIAGIEQIVNRKYGYSDSKPDVAFRVIADHTRAISFTIADGQLPASVGAGYVIRRILRRAVRYYFSYLQYKEPLLHKLIPALAGQFADVFPELQAQAGFVAKVIKEEEDSFLRTLDKGLKKIDEIISTTKQQATTIIAGKPAFDLYDTYGFPIDLTRLIAQENGLAVNEEEFGYELGLQKSRSRAATALDTGDWVEVGAQDERSFVGYEQLTAVTTVVKYRKVTAKGATGYQIVLNKTPFYAESGGQVGDKGKLIFSNETIEVTDTKKESGLIIHFVNQLPESVNGEVLAVVDEEWRKPITLHHTATHLLHAALRQVLGHHVAQKGSMVAPGSLRFDFSHFAKTTDEEIEKIEQIVNEKIRENVPVVITEMPKEQAMAMGAMALFGEKYGDTVRVVVIDPKFSIELCGGTHIANTGELGLLKITMETAVAAGVRRIEAVAGKHAENYIQQKLSQLAQIGELLKNSKDPVKAVEKLQEDKSNAEKKSEAAEQQLLAMIAERLLPSIETVNGLQFLGVMVQIGSQDSLRKLAIQLKAMPECDIAVLGAIIDNKIAITVAITDKFTTQHDAGKIVKQHIAPLIQGGGGGNAPLATASGQNVNALPDVIAKVKGLLA
ncbi:MAG: alanine--tRNA ligase [Chitinophagia bacterium]|nr:alanine--tRNA ligase [Chitinophagia bacterium]